LGGPRLALDEVSPSVRRRAQALVRGCSLSVDVSGVVTSVGGKAQRASTTPHNACVEHALVRAVTGLPDGDTPFTVSLP
jgi:hypothetical protein